MVQSDAPLFRCSVANGGRVCRRTHGHTISYSFRPEQLLVVKSANETSVISWCGQNDISVSSALYSVAYAWSCCLLQLFFSSNHVTYWSRYWKRHLACNVYTVTSCNSNWRGTAEGELLWCCQISGEIHWFIPLIIVAIASNVCFLHIMPLASLYLQWDCWYTAFVWSNQLKNLGFRFSLQSIVHLPWLWDSKGCMLMHLTGSLPQIDSWWDSHAAWLVLITASGI